MKIFNALCPDLARSTKCGYFWEEDALTSWLFRVVRDWLCSVDWKALCHFRQCPSFCIKVEDRNPHLHKDCRRPPQFSRQMELQTVCSDQWPGMFYCIGMSLITKRKEKKARVPHPDTVCWWGGQWRAHSIWCKVHLVHNYSSFFPQNYRPKAVLISLLAL